MAPRLPTTIDHVSEDLLQNIVARLPALSFASAACVSRSWNLVCSRVLCCPKLSSACLFNPTLQVAVADVVNKVLSKPIRPHFAFASIGCSFDLEEAYLLIYEKLGSEVPLIITYSSGMIGRDAYSDEFKEVEWDNVVDYSMTSPNKAIMLMVGFLPGFKIKTFSHKRQFKDPLPVQLDKFVTDISEFSASVSGCSSPAAIITFSGLEHNTRDVMEKLDYAMSPETVIVGDSGGYFLHYNGSSVNTNISTGGTDVLALVFVMDKNKLPGIGETRFHAVVSSGLSSVGPACKVASIEKKRFRSSNYLKITRERSSLDAETLWNQIYEERGTQRFYVGVTTRKECSIGQEKAEWMPFFSFHNVSLYDPDIFQVSHIDIEVGDTFRIYRPDSTAALSSAASASNLMRSFKQENTTLGDKQEVFGGLIFTSSARGESFFGQPNVDSSPFLDNFPGVTLGGTFCQGNAINGRGDLTPYVEESQEQKSGRCFLHKCVAVYLIMFYTP